jgi:hypothetical protein
MPAYKREIFGLLAQEERGEYPRVPI